MPAVDIIVVGASAGGLQALLDILGELPRTLPAPILAVIHTPPARESNLADVVSRGGNLPASFVRRDQVLEPGHVYLAPPDFHILVTEIGATLNHGPKENGFRPAIDPLFRTAAKIHGSRAMGIILSGALDDGAYGLKLIKDAGGVAVVQDPEEAMVQSMPLTALQYVAVEHVLNAAAIATLINELTGTRAEGNGKMPKTKDQPDPVEKGGVTIEDMQHQFGPATALTCPDCGGALWEIIDGQIVRYRCHVGHQYSSEALDNGQSDVVEEALWTAVRVLEEHADLRSRMSRRADMAGLDAVATGFSDSAHAAHVQAQAIRDVLIANDIPPNGKPANGRAVLTGSVAPPIRQRAPAKRKAAKKRR
jgi:two-component system, chemotaxis family, protein-glutamate methylesterase/glutaminase